MRLASHVLRDVSFSMNDHVLCYPRGFLRPKKTVKTYFNCCLNAANQNLMLQLVYDLLMAVLISAFRDILFIFIIVIFVLETPVQQ